MTEVNQSVFNHSEYSKKPFETTQSDLLDYNGQDFEVLGEQKDDIDWEVRPMWKVRFSNGFEMTAFSDEVFDADSILKIREQGGNY